MPARSIQSRRRLFLLLGPLVVLHVAGTVADWLSPLVLARAPLVELFLNPRLRYLALVADRVGPASFYSVAFIRLVMVDPLYFLLGLWYGASALAWIKRRSPRGARVLERLERWFPKAAVPILLFVPNGLFCLLAGAEGMSPALFGGLIVVGTAGRLLAIHAVAGLLSAPLLAANHFIVRYQWWLVGVSVGAAAIRFGARWVSGQMTQWRRLLVLAPGYAIL